ncbi:MAG: pyridine nucleotide-disulfide oxidoreductase [Phycisphaeraceae bacterium]|nr:pyridine nucleotide-disulfide oxidoreductase [Phycisphaeraceae bacterium]
MTRVPNIIVGAGPIGIELAAAFKLLGVDYVHLEAKQIGHTIDWFPRQVRFFSGPDRIAIAGMPLVTADQEKASREQYLAYLRSVVTRYELDIRTFEPVSTIERDADGIHVRALRSGRVRHYCCDRLVLATGDMNRPRRLDIPGENLPQVSHYFDDPHRYFRQRLLIVGGRNSAVEAAIRCQRTGADVTISYRRDWFDEQSVKYWLSPEIRMLIKTKRIAFHPQTVPVAITAEHVDLAPVEGGATTRVEADFVLLLVGYEMDPVLLKMAGVELKGENGAPAFDASTMETNVPGVYVAGTVAAGTQVRFRLFIENCHAHVGKIVKAVTGREAPFEAEDRTHSGRYALPES